MASKLFSLPQRFFSQISSARPVYSRNISDLGRIQSSRTFSSLQTLTKNTPKCGTTSFPLTPSKIFFNSFHPRRTFSAASEKIDKSKITKNISDPLHLDLTNKSIAILQAFRNYPIDWAAIHKELAPQIQEIVSPKKLEWEWREKANMAKAIDHIGKTVLSKDADGDHVITVKCRLLSGPIDVRFVFNAENLGLAGMDTALGPPDITNDYADSTLYEEKDVMIGEGEYAVHGKITLPKAADVAGNEGLPALILVPTNGVRDMDMSTEANKPFRDLAAGLAARGVAVIRYNTRSFEHEQKLTDNGFFDNFTPKEEIVDDAVAAFDFAKNYKGINPSKIFVAGLSFGAIMIPRIAKERPEIAGVALLNAPADAYENALLWQQDYIKSVDDESAEDESPEEREHRDKIFQTFKAEIDKIQELDENSDPLSKNLGLPAKYWTYLQELDQVQETKELPQRALLLFGGRDNLATKEDIDAWEAELYNRPDTVMKLYPDLHQYFILSTTELDTFHPTEFEIPGLVETEVLDDFAKWVHDPAWKGDDGQNEDDAVSPEPEKA